MMNKIELFDPKNQAEFDRELRRICRNALTRGIEKSARLIGINPGTLWNQLSDGRVNRIPAVTVAAIAALTKNIRPVDKLCQAVGHIALPVFDLNEKKGNDDSRILTSDILQGVSRMVSDKKQRRENGRDLIRTVFLLSNKDGR